MSCMVERCEVITRFTHQLDRDWKTDTTERRMKTTNKLHLHFLNNNPAFPVSFIYRERQNCVSIDPSKY